MVSLVALLLCGAASPDSAGAVERLQKAGIEVGGPFTAEEILALARGLDALPERLRVLPGGRRARVFLDSSRAPSPSGMAEPEWTTPTTFVLTPQQGFVSFRDETLDENERRLLWRSRAIVHLVLSRWDE
ncbi:MAG: hypothetical protein JNM17_35120, partial [Archangium sp.]|nr:hypothetical protein [Archangium sp.]